MEFDFSMLIYIMTLLNTCALNMLKIEIKLRVVSQMATLAVTSRQKLVIQELNKRKTIKTLLYKVWLYCQRHVLQFHFLSNNLIFITGNTLQILWIQRSYYLNRPVLGDTRRCLPLSYIYVYMDLMYQSHGGFLGAESKEFYYSIRCCFYRLQLAD